VKLEALERLAASMRSQQLQCQMFEHRHGRRASDVFFFVGRPSEMLIGARGARPPLAISLEVQDGGVFNPFLGEQYGALCDFLGLLPNPENPFTPSAFFQQMELAIPLIAQHSRVAQPQAIAAYRQVEEGNKVYFVGWRRNEVRGTAVTDANLEKTRLLLGWEAFDLCRRGNVSSCWTDDPQWAIAIDLRALRGQ